MCGIVGLAVWGNATEWSMPKFSALFGGKAEEAADWCDEHNVPESQCVECNKSLCPIGMDYGWCSVHGVMQCPLEHPDIAQLKTPPTITPAMLERANRAVTLRPRQENNSRCSLHMKRIQFASAESVEKVGVDIAIVAERPIVETIVGERRDWLRPDADGAFYEPRAGDGLARGETGGRSRGEGRRAGADRCGGSRAAEERVAAGGVAGAAEAGQRRAAAAAGRECDSGTRIFGSADGSGRGADSDASGTAGARESWVAGRGGRDCEFEFG